MKVKLTIPFCLCILTLWSSCKGQNMQPNKNTHQFNEEFTKGDTVKELGNSIMVVYQDRKNFYWFGSWETGVYKYDGNEIVNYTTKHGLLNNRIDEIKEDKFGNIYFGSANSTSSISKFNGNNFTTLTAVPSENWKLQSTDIWFEYSYGNTGKVYRYDGITLFELQFPNPPNSSNPFDIYSIYKDRKGNIWFVTDGYGICKYDGKTFFHITKKDGLPDNNVADIHEDKKGNIWIGTFYGGVSMYDGKTFNNYTENGIIEGIEAYNFCEDKSGNIWFSVEKIGVYQYNGKSFTKFTTKDGLATNGIQSIFEDKKGQIWFGTWSGISLYDGYSFSNATDLEPWAK